MDCSIWPTRWPNSSEPVCTSPSLRASDTQLSAGDVRQLVGAQHFQTAVNQPLRRDGGALGTQAADNGLHAGMGGVAHRVGG